jgi:ABC-type multidrug transport system ATPase subunit
MSTILEINSIKKSYGMVQALKGVSFQIPQGSVFGILGPNGSGKTTLLGILLDVLLADEGSFHWTNYQSPKLARQHIGSLLETPNFYHYLSAEDNLKISASIKQRGHEDIEKVLKLVNLYERRTSKFSTFSLGMKQRLAIGAALLGNPDILVLDEPTNGLDPVGIAEIRELILQLNRQGITIIIASHLLDEIEKVSTHVAILKSGNLITEGPVHDVLSDEEWIEINASNREQLLAFVKQYAGIKSYKDQQNIQISLHAQQSIEDFSKACFGQGIILNHISKHKRSLESKFMEITK